MYVVYILFFLAACIWCFLFRLLFIFCVCLQLLSKCIVSQFVSSGFFGFFNLDEFIEVIFPSFLLPSNMLLLFLSSGLHSVWQVSWRFAISVSDVSRSSMVYCMSSFYLPARVYGF